MAEAIFLSPIFKLVLGSLCSKIEDEISVICGVKKDLENLKSTMSAIEGAIADAEKKQARKEGVRDWLEKLKHVVYEVEDILDECAYKAHGWKPQLPTESRCNKQVSNPLSCLNWFEKVALSCLNWFEKVAFRCNIGHKIKDVITRLDEIAKERESYHFIDVTVPETNELDRRETGSFVDDSEVLGRKDEKEKIIKLLRPSLPSSSSSSSSSHDEPGRRDVLSVISIVGFGGLGKTTLAQSVYNDENVKEQFQTCMWVCVSENFKIISLVKMIIESLTKKKCEELSLDPLQEILREMLNGKRFLLVLDDVWNDNQMEWDRLIDLLRCGGKGSRMIVTTRNHKASPTSIQNSPIYLECLSKDDCWELFKQCAFRWRNEEERRQLTTIGQEIAKKCKGLPLAVKSIGGLLRGKRNLREWEVIRDSELWDFEEDGEGIRNSLRISYNHLPPYLKPCFVYCSIFPKDYEFEKEKLIKLWMAQGFIPQPSAGSNKEMEDIGNDYFNGLLWRSFFQDVKRDDSGNIRGCKMHDHLHDLAQYIGKNDYFVKQVSKPKEVIPSKVYHSSFTYDFQETPSIPKEMYELYKCRSYLRTLVVFGKNNRNDVPNDLFSKLRHLRVLDLSWCNITEIPDSIGKMIHLRYLNLSHTDIQRLPETTCNLWHLQTLNINHCGRLSKLPKGLKNMINLRHLEYNNVHIDRMPSGIGRLTCLQTLPIYVVGREEECGLGELQDLNLRGALRINKLWNNKSMEESKKANLKNKKHLHTLDLEFSWSRGRTINAEEEKGTLEGLQPHTNLRDLRILNYGGVEFPSWLSNSSLTNLISIRLYKCSNCQILPKLGELQLLESLTLEDNDNLNDWSTIGESNLSILTIRGCKKLRALPKLANLKKLHLSLCDEMMVMSLEHLPSLERLYIHFCSNITSLPESLGTLSALRTLTIVTCNELGSLPESLGTLSALRTLRIGDCSKLGSLPEGLKRLSTLECLEISDCPLLTERCREGGEDWNKIAHIRSKSIKCKGSRRPGRLNYENEISRVCGLARSPYFLAMDGLTAINQEDSITRMACPEYKSTKMRECTRKGGG